MYVEQLRGIFSREINKIVFNDGSTAKVELSNTSWIDDGELAECVTNWAVVNKHIVAGESIAVI